MSENGHPLRGILEEALLPEQAWFRAVFFTPGAVLLLEGQLLGMIQTVRVCAWVFSWAREILEVLQVALR